MSKSDWTVVVGVLFVVATFLGLPERLERFKQPLQLVAWICLAIALCGWLWAHVSTIQEWRTKVGNGPITLSVIGLIGAAAAIGLFLVWAPTHPKESTIVETTGQIETLLTPVANPYREVVAEIIHAFEPRARMTVGGAVIGPDGARTVDIQIWSLGGNKPRITAIDVIDRPDGKPVGIDAVDVADSKRKDFSVDAMLISSNTGFDDAAVRKAKRIGIGLIAALKRGDGRIKAVIEEEIYLRRIKIGEVDFTYDGLGAEDGAALRALKNPRAISYAGAPLFKWLEMQVAKLVLANAMSRAFMVTPKLDERITATFAFKEPAVVKADGREIRLKGMSFAFRPQVQWLSQIVRLNATTAIYDYVRGRVRMGSGTQQYVIEGLNLMPAPR